MTLPALLLLRAAAPLLLGVRWPPLSIDISCLRGATTNQHHASAAVDRWDRQTDGRTNGRSTVS